MNGDGIGDMPYAIPPGSNADRFPLISPAGVALLYASGYRLAASTGGTLTLYLHAEKTRAGRSYVLLGSATAREPQTSLPGAAGTILYFAYALSSPWDVASNPIAVELR